MVGKPTYEQLEQRVKGLEKESVESKRMEESLLLEKNFSESIIDSLPGIFYFFDEMGIDITDRRLAEEALRESESKFRNLFDLLPQAIALTDVKRGRLVDINNKFCELTKYSKEEILGLNATEVGFYPEADSQTSLI